MELRNKLKIKFHEARRFILFVVEHFIKDDCIYRASALAFTTLLAVVPLMTVGFTIFSSFPVFQNFLGPLQDFIFLNFVPATGKAIQDYLNLFTTQVSKLSIWGIAILIITALLVMVTIERAMNTIWRASTARHGVSALLLYWAILSLSPVFLGLSLAASSYLLSMPFLQEPYGSSTFLLKSTPFLLSLVGFTFLYVVVPNCSVKFKHGLWGALVAAILFESAKQAFAYYLAQYDTYQLLYGAFATIPIFFLWVYWGWVITLLGAEITYALSVHYQRRPGPPIDGFSQAILWLHEFWVAQKNGKGVSREMLVETSNYPFSVDVEIMLQELISLELIHNTEQGQFMLSRDLNEISLYWLSKNLPYRLPKKEEVQLEQFPYSTNWQTTLRKANNSLNQELNISLNQLYSSNPIP